MNRWAGSRGRKLGSSTWRLDCEQAVCQLPRRDQTVTINKCRIKSAPCGSAWDQTLTQDSHRDNCSFIWGKSSSISSDIIREDETLAPARPWQTPAAIFYSFGKRWRQAGRQAKRIMDVAVWRKIMKIQVYVYPCACLYLFGPDTMNWSVSPRSDWAGSFAALW